MPFTPRQQANYFTTLRQLVRGNEAFRATVYQPNDHVPTIGYGFTFVRKGTVWALYEHLNEDLLAIGRPLTGPQSTLLQRIARARNDSDNALAATLIAEFSISFGVITEGDAQTLFQRDVDYRGTLINSRFRSVFGQVEGDALFSRLAGSTEMMAVFDIAYYRGAGGLTADLILAMSRNDRAAAWYELRYRELPPNVQPGHPPRNYRDAELFSLYDTPGTATLPEAQAIYRLYTDNRTSIESYETSFPPPPDVSSVITALRPAKNTLLEWLRTSKGIGLNADAYSGTDVLLASELGQTLDGSFGDYRNAANVLIGDNGTDHLMGGAGDDLLFGSGDIDWLEGGSGNDTLYGNDGIGGDRLEGGAGTDTYHVDEGDTIRDSDGKGSVTLDDNILGTATRRKGEFAYRDSDGNAFVLIGSDLRINGNLLIEGFTSGDLGIVLKEDERDPYDPNEPDDPNDPNDPTDPANPGAPGDTAGPGGRDGGGGLGGAGATADGLGAAEIASSPLILDLDGDGVETLGINVGVTFDQDRNGFAEASGWVGGDDGLLVWDRNGNGQIDDGGELFGNNMQVAGANAANGFAALAALDGNADGKVDANDAAFADLRVWKDSNADGVTQDGELISLEQAEVQSLRTTYSSRPGYFDTSGNWVPQFASDIDSNGNQHRQVGSFVRSDGTIGSVKDVWFKTDTAYTVDKNLVTLSEEIAALPDVEAFGNVHDLRQAMQRDTSGHLKDLVIQFGQESSAEARFALVTDIVYHWAGVENEDQDSRGALLLGEARKLYTLEKFVGRDYRWWGSSSDPVGPGSVGLIEGTFNQLAARVYGQLMLQTHFKHLLDMVDLSIGSDGAIAWDMSRVRANLDGRIDAAPIEGMFYAADFLVSLRAAIGAETNPLLDALRATGDANGTGFSLLLANLGPNAGYLGRDIYGYDTDDALFGFGGDDRLFGQAGNDQIFGGQGRDSLFGDDGDDTLTGGAGDDQLDGGLGNDTYVFGRGGGRDMIVGVDAVAGNMDVILLSSDVAQDDVTLWRDNDNLYLSIDGTADTIGVLNWFEYADNQVQRVQFANGTFWGVEEFALASYIGTALNDQLYGTDQGEVFQALGGDDYAYGNGGDDTLDGGAGTDFLDGDAGNDTYVFARGYGQDTITDTAGTDVITLGADIAPSDVQIWRDASNLYVGITGTSDVLTVLGWYDLTANRVESITFADNTIWNTTLLAAAPFFGTSEADALYGTTGNEGLFGFDGDDAIYADAGNDTLDGGTGNDALDGGAGNDTYVFARGHGQDTITDVSGTDVITLGADITPSDVQIWRDASSLFVGITGTSDVLTILGWYDLTTNRVESIKFADNTIWNTTLLAAAPFFGTSEVDALYGTIGNEGLFGFAGDDSLTADAGNDMLDGGTGNDALDGGAGNDIYVFARGHGQDTITDVSGTDVITLGADIAPSDVQIWRDASNLYVGIAGTSDVLTVLGWYDLTANRVESITFADNTIWSTTLLAAAPFFGTSEADSLYGTTGNEGLFGFAGDDYLTADAGSDTLDGGTGNDALDGGAGNDTYVFARGHGQDTITDNDTTVGNSDVIRLSADVAPGDVTLSRDTANLYLGINGSTDVITVQGWYADPANRVERIEFADGTVWDSTVMQAVQLLGTESGDYLYGSTGDDVMVGSGGNDILYGDAGNDILNGGAGNDALDGGDGNDTYVFARGHGQDTITDVAGTDVITLGADIAPSDVQIWRDGSSLFVGITGTSDVLTVLGWYDLTTNRVESIKFADNTVWNTALLAAAPFFGTSEADALYGTTGNDGLFGFAGDDSLTADAGNDTLDGGTGNDALDGGAGNDTYVFARGHGQDTITDVSGTDVITLGADIAPSDVQIWRDASSLFVGITGTSDVLTVLGWYDLTTNRVESIKFADGTIWNTTPLAAAPFFGTSAADSLYGTTGNNTLFGFGGDDYVYADAGSDTLDGGTGNDALDGGAGNDTYVFARGHGQDTITDVSGTDVIMLGVDIAPSDVQIWRDASSLFVGITGTPDLLTVLGWYDLTANRVESIKFADNTIWSTTLLAAAPFFGTSAADSLYGTTGNNTLFGFGGNDGIYADAGNDTLDGGTGNDALDGGAGNDTYVFGRGYGQDSLSETSGSTDVIQMAADVTPADIFVSRDTYHLYLGIKGTSDKLTIQNWYSGSSYRIEQVKFADDTIWTVADLDSRMTTVTDGDDFNWGTTGNNVIDGLGGDDQLMGNEGDDTLVGGAGNDLLDGGSGIDNLAGGTGNDVYVVDNAGDIVTELADEGNDTVNSSITYTLGSNLENLTLSGVAAINGTGNTLDNVLTGNSGANTLIGLAGNDILVGGGGNDTYKLGAGHGRDTVRENDATAGNTDVAEFLSGIAMDQVWMRHVGNNLEASIIGTTDKLIVENWYLGSNYHVEQFKTADGRLLLDSQVENLVQAMAAFAPPTAGQTTLPPTYQDALAPVIAANWQ